MRIPCKIHDSTECFCSEEIECDLCGEVIIGRHLYFTDTDRGPLCRECFLELEDDLV